MEMTQTEFPTVTIRVPCPEGTAYVQILEFETGKIYKIIMSIGKAGSTVNAYCQAMADMATSLLHNGQTLNDVIAILSGITSDKSTKHQAFGIRSGPEALGLALSKYRTTLGGTVKAKIPLGIR